MVVLLWDASGLAKRYAPEIGTGTVDALFSGHAVLSVSSAVSYAEIYSILLRKFNRSAIDRNAFVKAKSYLRAELIDDPDFVLLPIDDAAFFAGVAFMEKYNVNATDAALLAVFQNYINAESLDANLKFVLVAADDRLLRAAMSEGIATVNPEALAVDSVPAFFAGL